MVGRELPSGGSEAPGVVEGDASNVSQAQHHRTATTARCTRCVGSLPLPLHLAIIRNDFPMMFPPVVTWTCIVGLCGLSSFIFIKLRYIKGIIKLLRNIIGKSFLIMAKCKGNSREPSQRVQRVVVAVLWC